MPIAPLLLALQVAVTVPVPVDTATIAEVALASMLRDPAGHTLHVEVRPGGEEERARFLPKLTGEIAGKLRLGVSLEREQVICTGQNTSFFKCRLPPHLRGSYRVSILRATNDEAEVIVIVENMMPHGGELGFGIQKMLLKRTDDTGWKVDRVMMQGVS